MADKLTQHLIDALSKAAAEPAGLPLFAARNEPGLFPPAARVAAQKAVADGLLHVVQTDTKGKTIRERFGLTERGWEHLLTAMNPRQVLEDFVRVLESRQDEVGELLAAARHMAEHLHGLKDAVARVLPQVIAARIPEPSPVEPRRNEPPTGTPPMTATAVLEMPIAMRAELADAVLARLTDWSGAAGEDCPLPELFHSLSTREPQPTIGEFHDVLRKLHADGAIYLHPWTGPLYALPEPPYALLVGHGVAYYASLRLQDTGFKAQDSGFKIQDSERLRMTE